MGVCVEESVVEQLLQVGLDCAARQQLAVHAHAVQLAHCRQGGGVGGAMGMSGPCSMCSSAKQQ